MSGNQVNLKGAPERRAVFNALVAPLAGGPISPDMAGEMIDALIGAAVRAQAQADAELMQKMSDRAPTARPSKGGTTSRAVFAEAARVLHPDELGWSLNLPDHLMADEVNES